MSASLSSYTLRSWIERRGLQDLDLNPSLKKIADQTLIEDRQVVIDRIAQEIRAGGLTVVASDYDLDGCASGTILTDVIRRCGGRVTMLTASRFGGEGYGLSNVLCDKVLALKPSVVVCCDFGSSDHDRLQRLKDAGVDALVIDHHLVPQKILPAYAFLNPHKPSCPSTFKHMCSGGLAWSVAGGLLKKLGLFNKIDIHRYLQLVALATIADVMPLVSDNRALVKAGLEKLRTDPMPGVTELMRLGKVDLKKPITGRTVGWSISPLLNAPGRIGSAEIIPRLIMATDPKEIQELGAEVQRLVTIRRELSTQLQEEAFAEVEANGYDKQPAIVLGRENWGHGLVGITAGRVAEKYGRPCVVFGSEGKGSARGPAGSKLHTALSACSGLLERFGGHEAAAGAEVRWDKLEAFRESFCRAVASQGAGDFIPDDISLKIDQRDTLRSILCDLQLLEPCGQGNPRPQIIAEGLVTTAREVKGGHLSIGMLLPNGQLLKGFRVGEGSKANSLLGKKAVWKGDLRPTSYGKEGVEMFIEEITSPL